MAACMIAEVVVELLEELLLELYVADPWWRGQLICLRSNEGCLLTFDGLEYLTLTLPSIHNVVFPEL